MTKSILYRISICLFVLLAGLGVTFLAVDGLSANAVHVASAATSSIVIPEPVLTPTVAISSTCQNTYWYTITTPLSTTAYLTLNTNNPVYSTNAGEWRPVITQTGYYQVEAYIPAHAPIIWCTNGATILSDTTEARYEIFHAGGINTVVANQRAAPGRWLSLGEFPFDAGSRGAVFLTDLNSETNFTNTVSFSAMRFTYAHPLTKNYLPLTLKNDGGVPPSPIVRVVQRQGFDKCTVPPINQMQVWWNESPYYIFNLYLGGVSFAKGCNPTATASWVAAVRNQGWAFIPTWVGLQAPCSKYEIQKRMSYDPATAYLQGRSEAEAAANAAAAMGLTANGLGGSIIYHDLEAYGGSLATPACRTAVKAFINGWVERQHELGNKAGVYGGTCSSNATDWATIPNIPDDAWLALWSYSTYNETASVWNLSCVSNSLWTNHQRIRQYNGSHIETWGFAVPVDFEIDSNISDGEVISYTISSLTAPEETGLEPSTTTLTAQQLVAVGQGWALADGRLLWTADDGSTWKDISPPTGNPQTAFFLDGQNGWVVSVGKEGFQVWSTLDGGSSWKTTTLKGIPDYAPWQPTTIQFVSPQTGWLALRQFTNSNFSIGLLFHTLDGGQTWTATDLPIAGKLFFESEQSGWITGGPAGNETYISEDGGQTWRPAAPSEQISKPPDTLPDGTVSFTAVSGEVWAQTSLGECRGFKQNCTLRTSLWKTTDNGRTWQPIKLP